jgi:Fe-S-cluster containining protein
VSDGLDHPCARCARLQRTCCQRAEVLVTDGDLERIGRHIGRLDFWERRPPGCHSYIDHDADDPNWVRLTIGPDGARRVLRRRSHGDCTFLGPQGCTLPGAVRPLVCRLYPWTYTERGLTGEDAEYCPVERLAPSGSSMLKVLDMKRHDAEVWRRLLYDELLAAEGPACASA